jgi:hypothetical protein
MKQYTKEEIEQLIIDAKHEQAIFKRVSGKMSQRLLEVIEQINKNDSPSIIRRAAFNEAYDKFVECEDGNTYTKWLNKVCD